MRRYRYRRTLAQPIAPGEDPQVKFADLCKDLGVDPDAPRAAEEALMALAERHVPGFRKAPSNLMSKARAGRKSSFEKQQDVPGGDFLPLWARIPNDVGKLNLYALVINAQKKLRTRGGRRYTKKEIVVMLSKQKRGPKSGLPNPYFGMNPKTLMSWVTHAGPNSKLRRKMARERAEAMSEFVAYMSQLNSEAKSKDAS